MTSARQRRRRMMMVKRQIQKRGITDPAVLRAMAEVPRELFLAEDQRPFAYDDTPLPIAEGQTVSQPFMVALMIAEMAVGPEDRVLEIGAGCGYAAAVLSRVAGTVHSVERFRGLVNHSRQCLALLSYDNVQVHHADGYKGWPAAAPYAAIVLTAAAPSIPQNLLDQLAPDGRLVAPIGSTVGDQELLRVTLSDDGEMLSEPLAGVRFVPMVEGVRP